MATDTDSASMIEEKIEKPIVNISKPSKSENGKSVEVFEPHLWGFETKKLYKIALNFYKEKEGKAVHLSYEDKLKLVAFTQQVSHGRCTSDNAPPLGVLDVIGKDRRVAWQNLGNISKEEAMEGFIVLLDKLCPLFKTFVEAQKRDIEEKHRLKREEEMRMIEEENRLKELEEIRQKEEKERLKQELQRRQIQDALNEQTYYQFKSYAEQQYPGNPEQQGVLIRQLQEQHYHQYMQQLHQNKLINDNHKVVKSNNDVTEISDNDTNDEKDIIVPNETTPLNDNDSDDLSDIPLIAPPEMWTKKGIEEFKAAIRKEAGDAIIKVGPGETITVRVPTHEDGSYLFWEFATDGYDIGFGVYFDWSKPETNQVSVHISDSEDDDDEEEDYDSKEDLESGAISSNRLSEKLTTPPIVPVYRRDSQEEIYAGSHKYPGQGVYLLKFDNSYSLWRSKTLYYRVYYTRPEYTKD